MKQEPMSVHSGPEVLLEHPGQMTPLHARLSEASCCSKVNTARLLNAVPPGGQQEGGHLGPRHCLRELAGPSHDAVLAAFRLGAHALQLEVEEAVPEPLVGDHAVVVAQDQARALVGGIHTAPTPMGSPSWGIVSDLLSLESSSQRIRLLNGHLFPSSHYMRETYAPHSKLPLSALYLVRLANGFYKRLRHQAPKKAPDIGSTIH